MTKFDRVMGVVEGKKVDYIPSGFWIHFPKETLESIDNTVKAHIEFLNKTDIDLFKVMNENEFRNSEKIVNAIDWKSIQTYKKNDKKIVTQKELLKRIIDANAGKTVVLGTIHGIIACLSHQSGISYTDSYKIMNEHFKNNKEYIEYALDKTVESIINMAEETIDAGVDGIYYAALGGERHKFSEEIFEEFIKPRELEIFNVIQRKKGLNVLHVCKDNVELKRYTDYNFDIINWGIYDGDYTLEKACELFKNKTILGGFDDRSGVLVDGTKEDLVNKTNYLIDKMKDFKFILGADCTLPTEISYSRIYDVVNISKNYKY